MNRAMTIMASILLLAQPFSWFKDTMTGSSFSLNIVDVFDEGWEWLSYRIPLLFTFTLRSYYKFHIDVF